MDWRLGSYALTAVATAGGVSTTSAVVNFSVVTPVAVAASKAGITNGQFVFQLLGHAGADLRRAELFQFGYVVAVDHECANHQHCASERSGQLKQSAVLPSWAGAESLIRPTDFCGNKLANGRVLVPYCHRLSKCTPHLHGNGEAPALRGRVDVNRRRGWLGVTAQFLFHGGSRGG